MKLRGSVIAITFACMIAGAGCSREKTANMGASHPTPNGPAPAPGKTPGPLPPSGFRAQVTLQEPPAKLRTGQQEILKVHVKNTSDVRWWLRGGETNDRKDNKFYIAAASRWLDKDGKHTDEIEGHNGIPRDLKPGDEADMTIHVTAPKEPGEYILEVDMVQEGVTWFSDKGSSTTRTKVTVVR
jgi:hypothetical protein